MGGLSVMAMHMHGIAHVDARENRKNIGLNKGNEDFKAIDGNGKGKRQPSNPDWKRQGHAEEDRQHGMTRGHVSEQPYGQREWPCQVADQFNRNHEREQPSRRTWRDEDSDKLDPVFGNPHDETESIHKECEGPGDDNLARDRIRAGSEAKQIAKENKHKEGCDKGEKAHPLLAHGLHDHATDKVHKQFRQALQLGWDEATGRTRHDEQQGTHRNHDPHHDDCLVQANIDAEQGPVDQTAEFKGMKRIAHNTFPSMSVLKLSRPALRSPVGIEDSRDHAED